MFFRVFVNEMTSSSSSFDSLSSDISSPSSPIEIEVNSTPNLQVKVKLGRHKESLLTCDADKENCAPVAISAKWRPKTHLGRLVKKGVIVNFMTIVTSKKLIKEPEIVDFLFKDNLGTEVLKVSPIGEGQYRFKVYAAVGNRGGYIGIGKSCGRTMKAATLAAERNAKLSLMHIPQSWQKSVRGCFANVEVILTRDTGIVGEPMSKLVIGLAGLNDVRVSSNALRCNWAYIEALKSALEKLKDN